MKHIAHVFLLLVGLGAAFLRWVDLVNYVDADTGFVLVGSVWWRYGAIALLCVLAFGAGFMASRRAKALEGGGIATGICLLVIASLCAAQNAVAAYVYMNLAQISSIEMVTWLSTVDIAAAGIAMLGLLCAVWLFTVAFSQFGKVYKMPAGGICLGLLGNFYFYAVLISRFSANQSSYHRLDPTVSVFAAAALIWFTTVLLRALYFPESAIGRRLYFAGLSCFYLCVGFALPQAIYDLMLARATFASVCESVLFAAFGVLGAIYATRALSKELAV